MNGWSVGDVIGECSFTVLYVKPRQVDLVLLLYVYDGFEVLS